MEERPTVLILCCNRLLKESVTRIVSKRTDYQVVASDALGFHPVREVADSKPDVVVLDSVEVLGDITKSAPNQRGGRSIRFVLVAMVDDHNRFLTAIRLGAWGYVPQDASAVEVLTAIRAVAQGEAVCPARYVRVLFDYFASQTALMPKSRVRVRLGLTRREQELVPLIDQGMTNKEIASRLNLSEQTVKNHIHRILRKVGVEDRLSVSEAVQTQTLGT